jgi:transposase
VAQQIDTPTAQGSYQVYAQGLSEVVTDKGYHSGPGLAEMSQSVRTYVSVPQQPRRKWKGKAEQQAAVYANRRRVEGERGKRLLRRRGELLERPFAHQYDTGALRRLHVRGRGNVAKRVLLQAVKRERPKAWRT